MTHPSHNTRFSDSSLYDEVCKNCGATDGRGDKRLDEPCPQEVSVTGHRTYDKEPSRIQKIPQMKQHPVVIHAKDASDEIESLRNSVSALSRTIIDLKSEKKTLEANLTTANACIETKNKTIDTLARDLNNARSRESIPIEYIDMDGNRGDIKYWYERAIEFQTRLNSLKTECLEAEQHHKTEQARSDSIIDKQADEISNLQQKIKSLELDLIISKAYANTRAIQVENRKETIKELKTALDEANSQLYAVKKELEEKRTSPWIYGRMTVDNLHKLPADSPVVKRMNEIIDDGHRSIENNIKIPYVSGTLGMMLYNYGRIEANYNQLIKSIRDITSRY